MALSLEAQVKAYAQNRIGMQVGTGECADLADQALKAVRAKSCADFGKVTATADYIWGRLVNIKNVQPGYILQYRNYKCTVRIDVVTTYRYANGKTGDGGSSFSSSSTSAAHHTSIVESVQGGGVLGVLEQNWKDATKGTYVRKVRRATIQTAPSTVRSVSQGMTKGVPTTITTTRTTTVSGTLWAYQPVKR